MIVAILAILSASAAAGLRVALPLLVASAFKTRSLWAGIPILDRIHPLAIATILASWSLFELFGTKRLLGQRALQIAELALSPLGGAILATAVARLQQIEVQLWLAGLFGGTFAFFLQLVQVGWFFRLRGLPIWASTAADILCVLLVLFAFEAPREGGLIALLLLWLAIRSANDWRQRYRRAQRDRVLGQSGPIREASSDGDSYD